MIDLPAGLAERLPPDVVYLVASQLDPSINTTATVREIEPQAQSATRTRRARLTLAQHWKDRSALEQEEFVRLFTELLEHSYLTTIENYAGEKIIFQGSKD